MTDREISVALNSYTSYHIMYSYFVLVVTITVTPIPPYTGMQSNYTYTYHKIKLRLSENTYAIFTYSSRMLHNNLQIH